MRKDLNSYVASNCDSLIQNSIQFIKCSVGMVWSGTISGTLHTRDESRSRSPQYMMVQCIESTFCFDYNRKVRFNGSS